MKKSNLLISFFIVIISGCSSVKPFPQDGGKILFATDFREYAKSGFTFSPFPPDGTDYVGLGLITTSVLPKIVEVDANVYKKHKDSYSPYFFEGKIFSLQSVYNGSSVSFWAIEVIDQSIINDLIRDTYNKSVQLGADGFYNFSIQINQLESQGLMYYSYEVSGYAVQK